MLSKVLPPTGKYTKDNLPGGARSLVINEERVAAVQPLLSLMRDIGGAHGGKTPGQVGPRIESKSESANKKRTRRTLGCGRCARANILLPAPGDELLLRSCNWAMVLKIGDCAKTLCHSDYWHILENASGVT